MIASSSAVAATAPKRLRTEDEVNSHLEKGRMKKAMKKSLLTKNMDDVLATWTQCVFYLTKKRRLCNLERCPNSRYCGTHRPTTEEPSRRVLSKVRSESSGPSKSVERIPCPIDPSHSIYRHNLHKHSEICNIKTRDDELSKYPYYCKDCNSGAEAPGDADPAEAADVDCLLRKVEHCYAQISSEIIEDIPADDDARSLEIAAR